MENWCEKEVPWEVKKMFSHYICCILRSLGSREIWSKNEVPKTSRIDPNLTTWAPFGQHFEIQGRFEKMWKFDEFWRRQNSINKLKILTKCPSNYVRHLDFGWPGGMRGPAGRGGRVKTLHTWSGRGLILELSLGFQNLNSLIQHALPSLREGRRKARARIPPGLRKGLPMGGVVLSFPPSSFDNFYQNRTKMGPKSITNGTNLGQGGEGATENQQKY